MSVMKPYGNERTNAPSHTFAIDGEHIWGMVDGLDAVRQAIDLSLSAERFEYRIYSNDYGAEFRQFIGKNRDYIKGGIERRIREALREDERVKSLSDFSVVFDRESAQISFLAQTIFGEEAVERSVKLG